MPREKIAILIPSLAGGGAERVALFAAEALIQSGYNVDLVVARNVGALVDHPVAHRLRVDLKAPNEMLCLPHLINYAKTTKPDLLIAMVHSAKIMAGLAKVFLPNLPLVISVHNNLDLPRLERFWPRILFGYWLERKLYAHVEAAHAVSDDLSQQVVRFFRIPRDRVHTIYNPVIPNRTPDDISTVHEHWYRRPTLVSVGRLVAQKDHETLLRAFAASGLAGRAHLLILGEGPLRPKLEALVTQLCITDDVCFAGTVPDVYPYLHRATGFVLSSRHEGLPLALVEALSAGLPIVAFDCLTGPAEILQGGRLGRLVSAGDIDGLAQAMRDMVMGHLKPAPPSEVSRHIARFDSQRIANQYVALVRSCLHHRGREDCGRVQES